MYKSNFAIKDGIKMRLFCCILKAGREHPERTGLCDDFVGFFCLKSGRDKVILYHSQLKTTGARKEVIIFIFLPLCPLLLPWTPAEALDCVIPLPPTPVVGKLRYWGDAQS